MSEKNKEQMSVVSIPAAAWQRLQMLDQDMAIAKSQFNLAISMVADTLGLEPGEWKLSPGKRAFVRGSEDGLPG